MSDVILNNVIVCLRKNDVARFIEELYLHAGRLSNLRISNNIVLIDCNITLQNLDEIMSGPRKVRVLNFLYTD